MDRGGQVDDNSNGWTKPNQQTDRIIEPKWSGEPGCSFEPNQTKK